MRYFLSCLFFLIASSPVFAGDWIIDHENSHITFSGTHSGSPFEGRFTRWKGTVTFDAAALQDSHAHITVDLSSAETGDSTYDKTLPQSDWLASAKEPQADFKTTAFRSSGDHQYEVDGLLTIRGLTVPVTLKGMITVEGNIGTFKASTVLNRMDYAIGKDSDAKGEWVSLEIPLDIVVVAKRQP